MNEKTFVHPVVGLLGTVIIVVIIAAGIAEDIRKNNTSENCITKQELKSHE